MRADHIIRDAEDEDAGAVAAIFDHFVHHTVITFETEPRSPEEWQQLWASLRRAGWPVLVAEVAGQVVGFAQVGPWRAKPAYAHTVETTVYLSPWHQRKGIGRALMEDLISRARGAGAEQLIAVIADAGEPASRALHSALGFRSVGVLRAVGRKFDRWIDVELMQHGQQ